MKLADALAVIREREAWELAEALDKWVQAQFDDDERRDCFNSNAKVLDYKIGD